MANLAVMADNRVNRKGRGMSIGLGVVLLVAGAIVFWALHFNISFVNDNALGIILMVAGALTIVLGLYLNAQNKRTKQAEERTYNT